MLGRVEESYSVVVRSVFDAFQEKTGWLPRWNNQTERDSATRLADEFGLPRVLEMIEKSASILHQTYAPRATKPSELLDKWNKIEAFKKRDACWDLDAMMASESASAAEPKSLVAEGSVPFQATQPSQSGVF